MTDRLAAMLWGVFLALACVRLVRRLCGLPRERWEDWSIGLSIVIPFVTLLL